MNFFRNSVSLQWSSEKIHRISSKFFLNRVLLTDFHTKFSHFQWHFYLFEKLFVINISFWLGNDWFWLKTQSNLIILTEKVPFWLTFNWESSQIDWHLIISQSFSLEYQLILSQLSVKWLRFLLLQNFLSHFDWVFSQFKVKNVKNMWKWLVFQKKSSQILFFIRIFSQKYDFPLKFTDHTLTFNENVQTFSEESLAFTENQLLLSQTSIVVSELHWLFLRLHTFSFNFLIFIWHFY